jgi:asparagine synthase (glutamine-hydrolysing)
MPGIFGIVDAPGPFETPPEVERIETVERMAGAMRYESSYSFDLFSCGELHTCVGRVGWPGEGGGGGLRRVAASVVLVTTGEPESDITPDKAGSADPLTEWSGAGARVVAEAYVGRGGNALAGLKGVFAGFLMDRRNGTCLLFNDRYGMERLFFHRDGKRTFFSSEAKAILAVAPRTRGFDARGLGQFLACGCTLGARSLFTGVEVLEGASVVSFTGDGGIRRRRYFERSALEDMEAVPDDEFFKGFTESLRSAVDDSVARAPRAGISLTGGLDSRMIMACLDAAPGSVPCYTFGSMYRETFDVAVGRQVAARCEQPHTVLELGAEFLRDARTNLEGAVFISDGYLGMSGAAELYLNRMARSIAPARMTGNWGGELLRGTRAFKYLVPRGGFLTPEVMQHVTGSGEEFASTGARSALSFTLFHQVPGQGYGRYAIERSQVTMRAPFLDNDVVRWLYQAPISSGRAGDLSASVIAGARPDLLGIVTDQGRLGSGPRPLRLARRVHRQGTFKAEYWTSHGAPDWVARLTASGPASLIPRAFLGRHKFQHFRPWYRRELADVVRDTLGEGNLGELGAWFDRRNVQRMVEQHLAGQANYTDEIDKMMTIVVAGQRLLKAWPSSPDRSLTVRGGSSPVIVCRERGSDGS